MDSTITSKELSTPGSGSTTDRTAEARRRGQTELDMKATTSTAGKKARASSNGLTALLMKVTLWTTTSTGEELTLGLTAGFIQATGTTIKCMAKASLNGKITESTKANMSMINKEGMGTFYWPDGRIYIGKWKDGKQHGFGKFMGPKTENESNADFK